MGAATTDLNEDRVFDPAASPTELVIAPGGNSGVSIRLRSYAPFAICIDAGDAFF
ncbi:hypothetical protein [Methylobacterium sp. J-090]|uniref:hypothetical protein n=1 Tax=Methylobacterium sp. J-090 TaxID=2836666 RepID=UPI001FB8FDA1|nr:hypothetical protein [Methylobacterium sp. J-090]MCJ2082437.1 hypothetical protein [Methylobacterium sp. J-090]